MDAVFESVWWAMSADVPIVCLWQTIGVPMAAPRTVAPGSLMAREASLRALLQGMRCSWGQMEGEHEQGGTRPELAPNCPVH